MKIALLFVGDGAQVILTPEDGNPSEKACLDALHALTLIEIKRGDVWARTQGGFYRQFDERPNVQSTLLVLQKPSAA